MQVVDLFSGIGGMSLGLEAAGMETIFFCEINPFCRDVLRSRWPGIPIANDITKVQAIPACDLICGGPPCQPFSRVGKQKGQTDERWMWPEMYRLVQLVRPPWVLVENVVGLCDSGLDQIANNLETFGYQVWPARLGAVDVGAPHRRERILTVGYADRPRLQGHARSVDLGLSKRWRDAYRSATPANLHGWPAKRSEPRKPWEPEPILFQGQPGVGGRTHGISSGVDRFRALGNAVVPQTIELVGRSIMKFQEIIDETRTA